MANPFKNAERDTAIERVYRDCGHTQTAIAVVTGVPVSRASQLITVHEANA